MDTFILTLIFVLPGLMGYYWIMVFGLNPADKHNSFEMLSLSILLWVPITFLNILFYNFLVSLNQNLSLNYIQSISDLQEISMFFSFQIYYIFSSLIISYIIARLIVAKGYKLFLKHINKIRKKLGHSELSEHATVWAEIFAKYGPKVVEISKIDNPHEKFIGCLCKSSRPLEPDRNIVINDIEYFTGLVQKNNIPIDKLYIDTKSGIMIKIFDAKAIDEAQDEPT